MRELLLLALLPACYVEARGAVEAPLRRSADSGTAHDLVGSAGFGASDDRDSGALMIGVEASPLVGRGPDSAASRLALLAVSARFERAFVVAHPTVRQFARLSFSFNPRASEQQRWAGVTTVALGIALTGTTVDEARLSPGVSTVGLALAYTHASDELLGRADFLGLELSLGVGGDPTPAPSFWNWSKHE